MKPSRLFASLAVLATGVFLWAGFVDTSDGNRADTAPVRPATTSSSPTPPTAPARPAAAAAVSSPPRKAAPTATEPSKRTVLTDVASNKNTDRPAPALFSPTGSVMTEAAQSRQDNRAIVIAPMPRRPLGEDGDLTATVAASATVPESAGVQPANKPRTAKRRKRAPATAATTINQRQASSFEHPLGVR